MAKRSYIFPTTTSPALQAEIPVWIDFYATNYSTFNSRRTRNYILSNSRTVISLPYPKQFNTSNTQNYKAGGSLNVQSVETGNMLGLVTEQVIATRELINSFFSGGGVIRFDHFETILEPGARRTHSFEFNLVAKTENDATLLNNIALIFQSNLYPMASTDSLLTMEHPLLWYFEASGETNTFIPDYWDGTPLPSVLANVDINRSPILNTPFTTAGFKPLAVNMKLLFIELEPAIQPGNATGNLMSRAERFVDRRRNTSPI